MGRWVGGRGGPGAGQPAADRVRRRADRQPRLPQRARGAGVAAIGPGRVRADDRDGHPRPGRGRLRRCFGRNGGRAGREMIAITARSLWARKRRLVATLLAVGLGVAFLAGTLLLSDTLRANFDRLFTQADSGTDVVLRGATQIGSGNATRTGVDASLLPRVRTVPGVADAQPFLEGYGQLRGRDGKPIGGNGPPTQAANWVGDPALNPYRLVAGHAPRAADEVVINRGAAKTGHLALGMTTTLLTPQPLRVHIVGIATFGTADGFGPGTFTGMTLPAARAHLADPKGPGPAELTQLLVRASPGVPDQEL